MGTIRLYKSPSCSNWALRSSTTTVYNKSSWFKLI